MYRRGIHISEQTSKTNLKALTDGWHGFVNTEYNIRGEALRML